MYYYYCNIMTLNVGWVTGRISKSPVPLLPRGSVPEEVEEEKRRVNWLSWVHLKSVC